VVLRLDERRLRLAFRRGRPGHGREASGPVPQRVTSPAQRAPPCHALLVRRDLALQARLVVRQPAALRRLAGSDVVDLPLQLCRVLGAARGGRRLHARGLAAKLHAAAWLGAAAGAAACWGAPLLLLLRLQLLLLLRVMVLAIVPVPTVGSRR